MSETNEIDVDTAAEELEAAQAAGSATPEVDSTGVAMAGDEGAGSAEATGDDDAADGEAGVRSTRSRRGSVRDLEEEGEVAADYLEELLDIIDVDGDIDIDVENGRASLAIVSDSASDRSLRRLVGSGGEVLEALQELTRLAVQASTGERSRLMLDVAGHRAERRRLVSEKAKVAIDEVRSTSASVSMEPMSAFERKIVHDVVADAGLVSESEGVDPNRHVVILPAAS